MESFVFSNVSTQTVGNQSYNNHKNLQPNGLQNIMAFCSKLKKTEQHAS